MNVLYTPARRELSITFTDSQRNIRWTYDGLKDLYIDEYGLRVVCNDGFKTAISWTEFDKVEVERIDSH